MDKVETGIKGNTVPIWEKYMLTVDEAAQYFGIGEKKIRMLISENAESDYCFTVQVGNKSLINRQKFEKFLNQTTALQENKKLCRFKVANKVLVWYNKLVVLGLLRRKEQDV